MPRKPQDVTDAELAVLQVLWSDGPSTIRALSDELYPNGGESEYATVKKLLARLESKRCVSRDRSSMIHVFQAAVNRQELVSRRLREVADRLCDGSWTPLLTHFANSEELTNKQQRTLNALIDELEQNQTKRK